MAREDQLRGIARSQGFLLAREPYGTYLLVEEATGAVVFVPTAEQTVETGGLTLDEVEAALMMETVPLYRAGEGRQLVEIERAVRPKPGEQTAFAKRVLKR